MNKKVYIVGLGAGDPKYRTQEATQALQEATVLCGYPLYLDLIPDFHQGKTILSSGMGEEVARCRMALDHANQGETVALVCSGDATIYGMTALVYQLSIDYPEVEIVVVAGVTAALTGGSLLGAPLSGDFMVLSLSDLLTPWETIVKRSHAMGAGDLVGVLYNPSSRKRKDYLRQICTILLDYRSPHTVCGYVRHIGRAGQEQRILSLHALAEEELDMFTTVFVGNSQTQEIQGKMVTPRGYESKYDLFPTE